jgi:hypothetical protein
LHDSQSYWSILKPPGNEDPDSMPAFGGSIFALEIQDFQRKVQEKWQVCCSVHMRLDLAS